MLNIENQIIKHHHYIIYKPCDFLSQFINNEQRKGKRKMLGELFDFPDGVMAIGRLDKHSEGLLLLTTDGMQSELVRSSKVEKEYYAQVDGDITIEAIENLENGVEIGFEGGKYLTKKCITNKLNKIPVFPERGRRIRDDRHGPTSWVSIILREGKYRQVRKMTAAVGFPTLRLVRVRIGNILLGDMDKGEVLEVTEFDV